MKQRRVALSFKHYTELDDPSPGPIEDWSRVGSGLHASFGSLDKLYSKGAVPNIEKTNRWKGTAWKGEKVSAQMVLWSSEPVSGICFEFSDFESDKAVLLSGFAQARFVRYVLTDEFGDGDGCADRKPEDFPVYLSPDVLDNVSVFDKEENSTRPVWLTFDVPRDVKPGSYTGSLHIHAKKQDSRRFELELEVQPRVLPPPSKWKFHLDLWQHPYSVAHIHGVELWSDEHWALLRPLMKMLADAGQKVITTTIVDKPWASQTLDPFESMVTWIKKQDDSWVFDYTVFDNWVEFMMEMGVDKQINAYSLLPWSSALSFFDESVGQQVTVEVDPDSVEYVELWKPFIIDFRAHLEEKGWNHITNLAMDEVKSDKMQLMLAAMDELAPEFGLASADSERAYKLFPDRIRDLTVTYAFIIDKSDLDYRRSKGYLSTFYVCCREPYPNTFTFSPPVEAVFLGWYTVANGFDGFLRWAFNSWVENPLHDSRFRKWPAGDTNFAYPDARSSIRFERLVEGIQDAEKVRILREEFISVNTREAGLKLQKLDDALKEFTSDDGQGEFNELVNQGKLVLDEVSR